MNDIVNHNWTEEDRATSYKIFEAKAALLDAIFAIGAGRSIKDTHPAEAHLLAQAQEHINIAEMYAIQALIVGPRTDEYWISRGIDPKYVEDMA